jgi:hypothetical protein
MEPSYPVIRGHTNPPRDPDPEIVMGHGRAFFRAVDLMELASLVKRLSDRAALRACRKT